MLELLLNCAAAAGIYLAFALLALSQEEHWAASVGTQPAPPSARLRRRWRYAAGTALTLAGALCVTGHGTGFGLLLWVLMMGAGIMAVAFTLSWKPHWLRSIAQGAGKFAPR
jgi:hypothetical protein